MIKYQIKIRKIDAAEYKVVAEIFNKYRIFYNQPSNIILVENYIKQRLENNEAHIFIACSKEASKPIGFTLLYPRFSSLAAKVNWLIGDMFVEEEHRRQGIGEQLLQTAINFAIEQKAVFVSLNTESDNNAARNLYEGFGFVKTGIIPGYIYYQYKL